MKPASESADGSSLCQQCALCCHGVLHDNARLQDDESDWADRFRVKVEALKGRERGCFELPCPHVRGTVCSIYADRPQACRSYECGLLRRHKAGEVSKESAVELIAEAKRLLCGVREVLAPGQSLREARKEWKRKSADWSGEGANNQERSASLRHLRMAALSLFLNRHFRT